MVFYHKICSFYIGDKINNEGYSTIIASIFIFETRPKKSTFNFYFLLDKRICGFKGKARQAYRWKHPGSSRVDFTILKLTKYWCKYGQVLVQVQEKRKDTHLWQQKWFLKWFGLNCTHVIVYEWKPQETLWLENVFSSERCNITKSQFSNPLILWSLYFILQSAVLSSSCCFPSWLIKITHKPRVLYSRFNVARGYSVAFGFLIWYTRFVRKKPHFVIDLTLLLFGLIFF